MKCSKCGSENVLVTIDNDADISRYSVKQVALIAMCVLIGLCTGFVGGIVGGVFGKIIHDIFRSITKDRFDNIVICQSCGHRSIVHHSTKLDNNQKMKNGLAIVLSVIGFIIGCFSSLSVMDILSHFVLNWLLGAMFMLFLSVGCIMMAKGLIDNSKTLKMISCYCFAISLLFLVISV